MKNTRILKNFISTANKTLPTVVFILGGPCSGKGTQSTLINEKLGYKHLSAGELLREERKNPESKYGQLIEQVIVSGKIVPSFITVSLLQKSLQKNASYSKFLIDGFPRNKQNLQKWNKQMQKNMKTPFIIYLNCSYQTMLNRLNKRSATSSRSDDNLEVMKKRFQTFQQETLPVVQWFRQSGRVVEVSSENTVQEIFQHVCKEIQKRDKL